MIMVTIPIDRSDMKHSEAMIKELVVIFLILLGKHAASGLGYLSLVGQHSRGQRNENWWKS